MSDLHRLSVDLPAPLIAALRRSAGRHGRSLNEEMCLILARALVRPAPAAKTSRRTDERLLAPLRALLADDIARATGWDDLQGRLAAQGYSLHERGGGLALHCNRTGQRLCKASELGMAYADLIRRFRCGFPGHSHEHLATRILGHGPGPASLRRGPDPGPDPDADPVLIEPF